MGRAEVRRGASGDGEQRRNASRLNHDHRKRQLRLRSVYQRRFRYFHPRRRTKPKIAQHRPSPARASGPGRRRPIIKTATASNAAPTLKATDGTPENEAGHATGHPAEARFHQKYLDQAGAHQPALQQPAKTYAGTPGFGILTNTAKDPKITDEEQEAALVAKRPALRSPGKARYRDRFPPHQLTARHLIAGVRVFCQPAGDPARFTVAP